MILEAKEKPRKSAFQRTKKIWIPSMDGGVMDDLVEAVEAGGRKMIVTAHFLEKGLNLMNDFLMAHPRHCILWLYNHHSVLGTQKSKERQSSNFSL